MVNKIKEFKEKHPKVYNGIKIGGAVILSAIAAYFIGKKVGVNKYSNFDAGWYVKSDKGFENIVFDEASKFLGCGIVRKSNGDDWVCIHDGLVRCTPPSLIDVQNIITKLIDEKIADQHGDTCFILIPNNERNLFLKE